jgi:PilZ domain
MNKSETAAPGADWTKLLTDPQIASHLSELLRAYREAPPEKRDRALLEAMRKIKGESNKAQPAASSATSPHTNPMDQVVATEPDASPPFEPDIFTTEDRRRFPRMKCFVAVELRMEGSPSPVWGNLSNTSRGGCFVETATMLGDGAKLEIGLWVANGKIWVKGLIINGVVTRSNSFGLRIKFGEMEVSERERLREFLKFVETTTKGYHHQHGYLAQIKR